MHEAAPTIGLQIQILNATTIGEIDAAFATFASERPDALFDGGDTFYSPSTAGVGNLPPWRRATGCRRLLGTVMLWQSVAR